MKESSRSILIWGSVVLGIVALMVVLIKLGTRPTNSTVQGSLATPVTAEDHIEGSADAPLTLVEYSDFQCPACAAYYPFIKKLVQDNSKDLRVVYRHYPLVQIHPNAMAASKAAEAAALQGKFLEMHDVLFNTQKQWSNESKPQDFFVQLAESIGLDTNKFKEDLNAKQVEERIKRDISSGDASRVQGTPSFYLNGKLLQISSYEDLQAAVQAAKNNP